MDEKLLATETTASSLKRELGESLKILKNDFESLKQFVDALAPDANNEALLLTNAELGDLLSLTQEIQDAADDIEFEADKIRDKLGRFVN